MLAKLLLPAACLLLQVTAPFVSAKPIASSKQDGIFAGHAPSDNHLIHLSIALQPADETLLDRTLLAVSDPDSERYGRHLTREEAKALLQPRAESTDAVRRWIADAGVPDSHVLDNGQMIHAHVPIERAETLLAARFRIVARGDTHVLRAPKYSVPVELRHHISVIHPSISFGDTTIQGSTIYPTFPKEKKPWNHLGPRRQSPGTRKTPTDIEACRNATTPACLREMYRIGDDMATPSNRSLFGIAGFSHQAAQYHELEQFIDEWAPYAKGANFSVESINDGDNPQGEYPSGEANLNIQYAMALAYDVPIRFYSTGGENHDFIPDLDLYDPSIAYVEPYLELTNHLIDLDDDQLPQVISISYGVNEQHLPMAYATQVCNAFGQLGTRGVSVVVAAGNLGPGISCRSNDGTNTTKFLPVFPASCPYVTTVGGTESNCPEVAWNSSSGGFSEYFSRPKWQDAAVGGYLKKLGDQWKGYYNPKGRGIPDVAAQADNYRIYNHDEIEATGGTSAAAPVFASIVALLNNERLRQDKPALGFLNPLIYKFGHSGFTDIKQGRSVGCPGTSLWGLPSPLVPDAGWSAVEGWDPVTGWGTPLYDKLKKLVTSDMANGLLPKLPACKRNE
ncbi:tripeptidyl-peptidase 1 precursor [Stachybotrys elegans]|uniref:tripeptidyl-peptidase II n=1 Tax=Stachybotrys elegans TaxID=80388 RepID=A0A8K0WWF0_9HYPO|nr:tripeptidyl-peptidase 1 precursor [Stachybotrys elegans]